MGKAYDCAFRLNEKKCSVLTKKACFRCPFQKTKEELEEGRAKAEERIKSLPSKAQREIHDKYYSGGMDDEQG